MKHNLLFYMLSTFVTLFHVNLMQAQFLIEDEHVFSNETLGIYGLDVVLDKTKLNNNGSIVINNNTNSYGVFKVSEPKSNYLGPGSLEFTGTQEFEIVLDSMMTVGSLIFNNGNNNVYFTEMGMGADSLLALEGASVVLEKEEAYLQVSNDHPEALSFINSPASYTYVAGRLVRNMYTGGFYYFPTGSGQEMFLLGIELTDSDYGQTGVRFNSQMIDDWLDNNPNLAGYELQNEGGWEVDNASANTNGKLNITAYKFPFINLTSDDNVKIAFFDPSSFPDTDVIFSTDDFTENTDEFVKARTLPTNGYYAIAVDEAGFNPKTIPNFVIGADGYQYYFKIPGIEKLLSSKLIVYDRWGREVFNETPYNNQFDTRDYPLGTYYYILEYDSGEGKQTYQSFFEVYKY